MKENRNTKSIKKIIENPQLFLNGSMNSTTAMCGTTTDMNTAMCGTTAAMNTAMCGTTAAMTHSTSHPTTHPTSHSTSHPSSMNGTSTDNHSHQHNDSEPHAMNEIIKNEIFNNLKLFTSSMMSVSTSDYDIDDEYLKYGMSKELELIHHYIATCAVQQSPTTDRISPTTDRISTDRISTDRISTDRISTDRISTDRISTDRISGSKKHNHSIETLYEMLNLINLKSLKKRLRLVTNSTTVKNSISNSSSMVKSNTTDTLMNDANNKSHDSMNHSECEEDLNQSDDQKSQLHVDEDDDDSNTDDLEEYEEELLESEIDNDSNHDITEKEEIAKMNIRKSIVDDDFFSLEEMEKFAELSEAQDIKMANKLANRKGNDSDHQDSDMDDDDDIFSIGKDLATGNFDFDLDLDDDDQDNANDIRYEDFFVSDREKKKTRKTWQDDMEFSDGESTLYSKEGNDQNGGNDMKEQKEQKEQTVLHDTLDLLEDQDKKGNETTIEQLSSFEKRQLRMKSTIEKFENENMAEKEWTMKGEVSAKARPVNSLLEQDLDVDIAAKPVPVITEETTQTLGELIIQRIKDNAFDDVIRKDPPKDSVYDPNRRWELDDEKSKKSLGEIYEEEYQKKVMNAEIKSEKSIEMEASHAEITKLMTHLFQQLDSLSNFHYTPPPAELELEVVPVASAPAISMEEVIPSHVSSATLATPAEVYSGKVSKSQAELDSKDKTNLRKKAKRKAGTLKKQRESVKKAKLEKQGLLEHQISKQKAIHSLMGQKNVTLVIGGGQKASGVGIDRKKATHANMVREGEKVGPIKETFHPSMLKL